MALAQGIRLGPYEILTPLGSGGMGEVYRARDSRLGRDVAVKVLPPLFARDKERLQRFEHEARAVGALSHPNVVAVFDVGATDGIPYLVSELLEGQSLGDVIRRGPVQPRRAIEFMIQAASGLAAAHAKGIVHRDLKPENLFVLPDGRLKILDFGLAKLLHDDAPPRDETGPQLHTLTQTGQIMGTASYMAPEQIRDQPVDHRADLFALGAILHELITGAKAFPGETPADRMTAILTLEPAEWDGAVDLEAPGLALIARRCLEKRTDQRFVSSRDLELALQVVEAGMEARRLAPRTVAEEPRPSAARVRRPEFLFRRLTFMEGEINGARFTPDGQTVVYSASWDGGPPQLYLSRVGSVETRPLGVRECDVLAVSKRDEIAVLKNPRDIGGFIVLGTLARVPLIGGVPREMLDRVVNADWSPDGRSLLVLRDIDGRQRLEYPIGTVLHEAEGWMSDPRLSPDGTMVAFREHPVRSDNGGFLKVIDLQNRVIVQTEYFSTAWRHAWDPSGQAIWFSAASDERSPGIYRMTLDGTIEPVYQAPTYTTVEDVSPRGDILALSVNPRMRMQCGSKEGGETRDLSWLDWSLVRDISLDGEWVLFGESGVTGGGAPGIYIRRLDGSPAIRLGDGDCWRLSPDFRWVLITQSGRHDDFALLPTGAGPLVPLPTFGLRCSNATWFPDGKGFIALAAEKGQGQRLHWYDLETKTARPIRDELFHQIGRISPDGRSLLAIGQDRLLVIVATDGSSIRQVGPAVASRRAIGWNREGTHFFTFDKGTIPAPIFLVDAETGEETPWLMIETRERHGVNDVNNVCLTPDGMTYVASYPQTLSSLYAIQEVP